MEVQNLMYIMMLEEWSVKLMKKDAKQHMIMIVKVIYLNRLIQMELMKSIHMMLKVI